MHKLPKKLAKIKLVLLAIVGLLISFSFGLFTSSVFAQYQIHSLRPYPESPFNNDVSDTALFCGNNLIVADEIEVSKGEAISCTTLSNGDQKCTFRENRVRGIRIDLSDAKLPILGNTENVINSDKETDDEGFDDAGKMNEYLSWYLNGTINRAEYEFLDARDKEDIQKLINYSGPINKLLPWEQQARYRINTIEQIDETRHNQVVACTRLGIPVPCYNKDLLSLFIPPTSHFLSEWGNYNFGALSGTWRKRIPPLREDFDTFLQYWKAYKEWRGDTCRLFTIPIINKEVLLCFEGIFGFDNPLKPNYWADLFPYIPLSSTEDRKGLVETEGINTTSPSGDVIVTNVSFTDQKPAELFFAHTEEVADLASILQKTFVSQNQENNLSPSGVVTPEYCDLVNVRTNEGDNLYAGEIEGTLTYTAEFTCTFSSTGNACERTGGECITVPECLFVNKETVNGGDGCEDEYDRCCSRDEPRSTETCTKEVYANMSVITKTPKVDEIWGRLVAGSSAVFKKMFPKVGPNTDLGCILDIPGATKVSYSEDGLIYAGNPGSERSGESAELYFPHIGGVYEYFLKGTQTLLRPKGYGENIVFGSPGDPRCIQNTSAIDICSDDCNSDPTNINMNGVKDNFIDLANRWLASGSPRVDKYDQVVNTSLSRGVDPIFTLAIWLHESGASNYAGICNNFGNGDPSSLYCQRIQDFGINRAKDETIINSSGNIIKDNFSNQLGQFVNLPDYYLSTCYTSHTACPWEIFGAMYTATGTCTPNDTGNEYVKGILEIYRWLSPTQQLPCYASKLPN